MLRQPAAPVTFILAAATLGLMVLLFFHSIDSDNNNHLF